MTGSRRRQTRLAAAVTTVVLAVVGLSGCGSSDAGAAVRVIASTDVWGDVTAQVAGRLAGSRVAITSLITDPAADPHSFEASGRSQLAVSRADVVIENGGGYDDFVDSMLKTSGGSSTTVLNAVDISGVTAPAGGELNEHVWYDVDAVRAVAARIAAALAKADPTDRATFAANLAAFDTQLASLTRTEATIKAAYAGRGVAITEPVPLYLLQACGLVNRTPAEFSEAVENGTDVSASVLTRTEDLFDDHEVSALVYNEQTSGAETKAVLAAADRNDIPVVPVTETLPDGKDYVSWMRDNLAALQSALAGTASSSAG